jgi:hypothetical protein
MAEDSIARRSFLKGAGAAGAAAASVLAGDPPDPAHAQSAAPPAEAKAAIAEPYLTLTAAEAAFLSAAYDTLIPADALSPSGTDCGLVTYIDGRRRALERRHLAFSAERIRPAQSSDAALWSQRNPGGHDDPGLGPQL